MTMIFVTPAEGARVRMPERGSAVMEMVGAWVPRNVHYETLIRTGDVALADPQPDMPTAEADSEPPAPIAARAAETARLPHRTHAPHGAASKEK
jgi:hypothetical protein